MDEQHRSAQDANQGPGRPRPGPIVAIFASWTLFVWVGRLRNLWLEPGGWAEAGRWSLYGSLLFTVLGLTVALAWAVLRFSSTDRPEKAREPMVLPGSVMALAALTIGVWLVRAVDITLGDHAVGFIAVHVVLAAVSIGLAVASVRSVPGRGDGGDRPIITTSSTKPAEPSESGRSSVG